MTADRPTPPPVSRHRYACCASPGKFAHLLSRPLLLQSLSGVAAWLVEASRSTGNRATCHRSADYYCDGRVTWRHPNSNTPELISGWLDLAELLEIPEYQERAVLYANRLLEHPSHGFYQGPEKDGEGLLWYWSDSGSYGGFYACRAPRHFLRLYELTGDHRYFEICETIGRSQLRHQLPSGLINAAWSPTQGWSERTSRAACRYLYPLATFATLYKVTKEEAYRSGYERCVEALQQMQNADGSFYQYYEIETAAPSKDKVNKKPFFYAYLLNAFSEAYESIADARVLEAACRLGDHIVEEYTYKNVMPYCVGDMEPTDLAGSETFVADSSNGMLWLARLTQDAMYHDTAMKIFLDAWKAQIDNPGLPGWHGAIFQGANPRREEVLGELLKKFPKMQGDPNRIGGRPIYGMLNHLFAIKRLLQTEPLSSVEASIK